jgi:hypothetical protein
MLANSEDLQNSFAENSPPSVLRSFPHFTNFLFNHQSPIKMQAKREAPSALSHPPSTISSQPLHHAVAAQRRGGSFSFLFKYQIEVSKSTLDN